MSLDVSAPFTRLNDEGICERCQRGTHRLCKNPFCACDVANAGRHSHANRPPVDGTPPQPRGAPVTMTRPPGPITPIRDTPKKQAPVFELKRVDKLPEPVRASASIADRVANMLAGQDLDADTWYELITYQSSHGGGGAASRLNKASVLSHYEFAARGNIVYVRLAKQ